MKLRVMRCVVGGLTSANVIQPFTRQQEQYLQLHRECLR